MKVRGSYEPNALEYEVLNNGTAVIRLYENITQFEEPETDDTPATSGFEFDRYTLRRPHTERLRQQVEAETDAWLEFAKQEEIAELAAEVRTKRNKLLGESDITQLIDAPISDAGRTTMQAYRQVLRDIPGQSGFPYTVDWPECPSPEELILTH